MTQPVLVWTDEAMPRAAATTAAFAEVFARHLLTPDTVGHGPTRRQLAQAPREC